MFAQIGRAQDTPLHFCYGENMEPFIIFIIFVGIVALIVSPFFKKTTEVWEAAAADTKLTKLKAAKDSYYTAIKDVDFEYAEGKLSEKDHDELRGYYKEKAMTTIREMEKLKGSGQQSVAGGQKEHKKGKKEHR